MTDSCKEIFGSSHHSVFTWKTALRTVLWVREFEPSLFEPGVYFNIKYIGKLPGPTNEFEQSLVFETGEFERPKFDCMLKLMAKNKFSFFTLKMFLYLDLWSFYHQLTYNLLFSASNVGKSLNPTINIWCKQGGWWGIEVWCWLVDLLDCS